MKERQGEVPRLIDLPDGLTVREAAQVLRIAPVSVYLAIQHGQLFAVKLGRRLVVPRSEVARLLQVEVVVAPKPKKPRPRLQRRGKEQT